MIYHGKNRRYVATQRLRMYVLAGVAALLLVGCPADIADTTPPAHAVTYSVLADENALILTVTNPNSEGVQVEIHDLPDGATLTPNASIFSIAASESYQFTIGGLNSGMPLTNVTLTTTDIANNAHNEIISISGTPFSPITHTVTVEDGILNVNIINPNGIDVTVDVIDLPSGATLSPPAKPFTVTAGGTYDVVIAGITNFVPANITLVTQTAGISHVAQSTITDVPYVGTVLTLGIRSQGSTLAPSATIPFTVFNLSRTRAYRLLSSGVSGKLVLSASYGSGADTIDGTTDISEQNRLSAESTHTTGIGATYFPEKYHLFLPGVDGAYVFTVTNEHLTDTTTNITLLIQEYVGAPRLVPDGNTRYGNPNFATENTYYYVFYTMGVQDSYTIDAAFDADVSPKLAGNSGRLNPLSLNNFITLVGNTIPVPVDSVSINAPTSLVNPQIIFFEIGLTKTQFNGITSGLFFTISAPY